MADTNIKRSDFDDIFFNEVTRLISESELELKVRTKRMISIYDKYQYDFHLKLELDNTGSIIVYFVFRTSSWVYDGERTDLHDCFSLFFSLCCLINNYSISLWDIKNDFIDIESELYGRYATISQPNLSVITQDEIGIKRLQELIDIYINFMKFTGAYKYQSTHKKDYKWDVDIVHSIREKIALTLNILSSEVIGNIRCKPDWLYFQVYTKHMSIIKSKLAVNMYSQFFDNYSQDRFELVDDDITFNKKIDVKHCYSLEDINEIKLIFNVFDNEEFKIFSSESHIFLISEEWIITKRGSYGLDRFNIERKAFSEVITKKINFLYENISLKWLDNGSPSRFEDLCNELLSREQSVSRTRKVSHTNERDKGRDLIAEIIEYKPVDELIGQDDQPLDIKRYLVQCKLSSKNSIGLSKGMSPWESLLLGDYHGYMLITNTFLSSDFTEVLERIRSNKEYNADWWTKIEIEDRLKRNIDLLVKYNDLVSYDM